MKWTKAYRRLHGKEMTLDSTFDFEKRRNVPIRYNRDLWVKTIKAMQVVDKIRQIRKVRFHKQRLAKQRKARISMAEKEISKNEDLLKMPSKAENRKKFKESLIKREKKMEVVSHDVEMSG